MYNRYAAFRVETQIIRGNKAVNGWFILGQREDTLKWDLLIEAETEEDAKRQWRRATEEQGQLL